MTSTCWNAPVPPIFDIIENISDFVARQEQSSVRRDARFATIACRFDGPRTLGTFTRLANRAEHVLSLFDETTPSRAASTYSKSAEARQAERFRKVAYLLALLCI